MNICMFFAELQRAPFKSARLSNGGVGIVCNYNNEDIIISAEHLFAMVLVKTKEVVANANGKFELLLRKIAVYLCFLFILVTFFEFL